MTPGPWELRVTDGRYIVSAATGHIVAAVWDGEWTDDDAALVVCAPELLAMVRDLRTALERDGGSVFSGVCHICRHPMDIHMPRDGGHECPRPPVAYVPRESHVSLCKRAHHLLVKAGSL